MTKLSYKDCRICEERTKHENNRCTVCGSIEVSNEVGSAQPDEIPFGVFPLYSLFESSASALIAGLLASELEYLRAKNKQREEEEDKPEFPSPPRLS